MLSTEMAMRCDAKILAMRALAAKILCDALPRCEEKLSERFQGLSGVFPESPPGSPSCTGGAAEIDLARGDQPPILKEKLREFGLKFYA